MNNELKSISILFSLASTYYQAQAQSSNLKQATEWSKEFLITMINTSKIQRIISTFFWKLSLRTDKNCPEKRNETVYETIDCFF